MARLYYESLLNSPSLIKVEDLRKGIPKTLSIRYSHRSNHFYDYNIKKLTFLFPYEAPCCLILCTSSSIEKQFLKYCGISVLVTVRRDIDQGNL